MIFVFRGGPLTHFSPPNLLVRVKIRLHPEFRCPRPCGSALNVPGGGWGGVVVGWEWVQGYLRLDSGEKVRGKDNLILVEQSRRSTLL